MTFFLTAWLLAAGAGGVRAGDGVGMQVRITWGGGARAIWRGMIRVNEGAVTPIRTLGLDEDAPGAYVQEDGAIPIVNRSAHAYDALDIRVDAPLSAILQIDLSVQGATTPSATLEVPLTQLIRQPASQALDDTGNLLFVQRTPGDALRVEWDSDHLVFAPYDSWRLRVTPAILGVPVDTSLDLRAQLRDKRSRDIVWRQSEPLVAGVERTSPESVNWDIPMPSSEGVYDLELTLRAHDKRLFWGEEPIAQRIVQVVVVDNHRQEPNNMADDWAEVASFDPTESHWWDRLVWPTHGMPHLRGVPPRVLGSQSPESTDWDDVRYSRIAPGAWRAFPLPIKHVDRPHMVEVRYPRTYRQVLGVAVVEADAQGVLSQLKPETCIDVVPDELTSHGEQTLRLVFWPKSHQPYLLVTNRHAHRDALMGQIRVTSTRGRLRRQEPEHRDPATGPTRRAWAYFDKPLFPETFSAGQVLDPQNRRPGDDWQTFLSGARRMADYLKYIGYDGVALSAWSEGSTIYPADMLDPTPKYDTGAYFTTGQDPVRKDVLELLFRVFDREGLTLVPALHFSGPLPNLERLRRTSASTGGIVLTNAEGHTHEAYHPVAGAFFTSYNPLDLRVQAEMVAVVEQIAKRYGNHPSFGGVTIEMADGYCTHLPDATWGADPVTVQRYLSEQGAAQKPASGESAAGTTVLVEPQRTSWLQWRAAQMAKVYGEMARAIQDENTEARLFLAPMPLQNSAAMRAAVGPSLPTTATIEDAMLEMGIDPQQLSAIAGVTMLRTEVSARLGSIQDTGLLREWRDHPGLDNVAADHPLVRGTLAFYRPAPLRLHDFDEQHPFGPLRSATWLAPEVTLAEDSVNQTLVHAIATRDASLFLEGGWTMLRGQPDARHDLLAVYRQLPAGRFETYRPAEGTTSPILIRTRNEERKSYVYLVNDSPWRTNVVLRLTGAKSGGLRRLTENGGIEDVQTDTAGDAIVWGGAVESYGMIALSSESPALRVASASVEYSEQVVPMLRRRLTSLSERVATIATPQAWDVLRNPGFEIAGGDAVPEGWNAALGPGIRCEQDEKRAHSGQYSCRIESDGPVAWVRSVPFNPPSTGRLAFRVWIRGASDGKSPPLRLAVEGKLAGKTYYRHAPIESESGGSALGNEWAQYVLRVDDLPQENLEELRIGFDLMGPGTVWFDDIQIHDLSFTRGERVELSKAIGIAESQLSSGDVRACWQTLQRYWPQFLEHFVTVDASLAATATPVPPKSTTHANSTQPQKATRSGRMMDRVRRLNPFHR